jgi:predicted anti-sigma-YlaC factor YlaD
MDDCQSVIKLLYPYLDRELGSPEGVAIDRHLASCPACRTVFDSEREFLDLLKTRIVTSSVDRSAAFRLLEGVQLPLLFPETESPRSDS